MYCQYCGKPVSADAKFCPNCGKRLAPAEETSKPELDKITITRKGKDDARLFKLKVSLDSGKPVPLKCGETVSLQVSGSNPHTIKLTLNAQSKECKFEYLGFPITVAYEMGDDVLLLNGNKLWREASVTKESSTEKSTTKESDVLKFAAKTQYNNEGYLEVSGTGLSFELSNGTVLSFPFSEIKDVKENFGSIELLMTKSNTFTFKLAHKDVKQVGEIIERKCKKQYAAAHPESSFDKSYGWLDKVMVNQQYSTFCIQPSGEQPGPVYKIDDILDFDIQDVIKEIGTTKVIQTHLRNFKRNAA